MSQIAPIGSADDAAPWAYCNMQAKNGLMITDARQVEEAFETKLAGFTGPEHGLSREGNAGRPKLACGSTV